MFGDVNSKTEISAATREETDSADATGRELADPLEDNLVQQTQIHFKNPQTHLLVSTCGNHSKEAVIDVLKTAVHS